MNAAAKLSAYGAALALLLAGGFAVGTAVGPLSTATADSGEDAMPGVAPAGVGVAEQGDAHSGTVAETASDLPAGLASSRGGYTLTPTDSTLTPGTTEDFSFRITGPDGAPVTAFDVEHDKRMHLIVVRRDATGFQHVHPEMAADGTWSVPLTVPTGGSYRAFADFTPTGSEGTTLGVDLSAPGTFDPATHSPARTAVVDGYEVQLSGDLVAGRASSLTLTVRKDGQPVTDLQPYLAAYGHLVALRDGDLAYLHVHPEGTPGDGRTPAGPEIEFIAEVPSAGTYRLFLDFQHGGTVRTAAFTAATSGTDAADPPTAVPESTSGHGDDGHGH